MTNTTTKQAHNIVVRDFGPDGTGISVVVHRLGCSCRSLYASNVVSIGRVEAHEDEHVRAGVVAQRHGLDWYDYSVCDCALAAKLESVTTAEELRARMREPRGAGEWVL